MSEHSKRFHCPFSLFRASKIQSLVRSLNNRFNCLGLPLSLSLFVCVRMDHESNSNKFIENQLTPTN